MPRLNRRLQRSIVQEWQATLRLLELMRSVRIDVRMTNPLGLLQHKALVRDHKKLLVVDGDSPERAVAYAGGINLSDHNASWNDFMVKMTGDMVPLIQDDLDRTWEARNRGRIEAYSEGFIIADSHGRSVIIPVAQHLVARAQERVVIESAYLWSRGMWRELEQAARRGVDVSVIVPLHNNKRILVPSERRLRITGHSGVHVYRFQAAGGMTHARALLTDGCALFGSNTFSELSAGRTEEIGVLTDNASLVAQLERFLEGDMKHSIRQS